MDDVSLRKAVDSKDDSYIRTVIRDNIRSCNVCVCLVGENTHRSRKWVPWEIALAAEEQKSILAMTLKDIDNAITPSILVQHRVTPHIWDVDWLFRQIALK
jgi:hypothetical protein